MTNYIMGLDLETTGLKAGHDRIIELCIGIYDENGTHVKNLTARFNPMMPIDPKAQAVHGISNEDLHDKPKFEDYAQKIAAVLSKASLIVIHNSAFDAPFLSAEFIRCGVVPPKIPVYDTMLNGRNTTPNGKFPKLKELCWAYDVEYRDDLAHAADYDVDVMMKAFFRMTQVGAHMKDLKTVPFDVIKGFRK